MSIDAPNHTFESYFLKLERYKNYALDVAFGDPHDNVDYEVN